MSPLSTHELVDATVEQIHAPKIVDPKRTVTQIAGFLQQIDGRLVYKIGKSSMGTGGSSFPVIVMLEGREVCKLDVTEVLDLRDIDPINHGKETFTYEEVEGAVRTGLEQLRVRANLARFGVIDHEER